MSGIYLILPIIAGTPISFVFACILFVGLFSLKLV